MTSTVLRPRILPQNSGTGLPPACVREALTRTAFGVPVVGVNVRVVVFHVPHWTVIVGPTEPSTGLAALAYRAGPLVLA